MGILKKFLKVFDFFWEKKVYCFSYFGPFVILSFIIKLSKIRKMHAKLVKIRQCKGFYFGMGLIELSMKNMFLHKYIYRVCYVWKFYDQFFNDILSIIIKIFSKYVGPNWMLHSLKWRPLQNKKSNQFFFTTTRDTFF